MERNFIFLGVFHKSGSVRPLTYVILFNPMAAIVFNLRKLSLRDNMELD